MAAPSGALAMPAFDGRLSTGDRWALIDFLKAHNAGSSMRSTGQWRQPIQLPQFDAICPDGSAINLDDLRGRPVHVIAGNERTPPPEVDDANLATIVLTRDGKVKPAGAACVTIEPTTWDAFAILLGLSPDTVAGTQALADRNGWLRARWRSGDPADWTDPQVFTAVIRDIAAHPLAIKGAGGHAHH